MRVGFIGAGAVGSALAQQLSRRGYGVCAVFSRTRASARRLAEATDTEVEVCASAQAAANACRMLFITTPDDAVGDLARSIAWRPGQQVAHTSGSLSLSCLDPVVRAGGEAGSFHPLQTFSVPRKDPFAGCTVALAGTGRILEDLQRMARALGCRAVTLRPEDQARYHVSAVLACNYLVTLTRQAVGLWEGMGFTQQEALEALLPLLQGTVDAMAQSGLPASLTGPIARGDTGTVAAHLEELGRTAPQLLPAYRELGRLAVDIALEKETIDQCKASELKRALQASLPERAFPAGTEDREL